MCPENVDASSSIAGDNRRTHMSIQKLRFDDTVETEANSCALDCLLPLLSVRGCSLRSHTFELSRSSPFRATCVCAALKLCQPALQICSSNLCGKSCAVCAVVVAVSMHLVVDQANLIHSGYTWLLIFCIFRIIGIFLGMILGT